MLSCTNVHKSFNDGTLQILKGVTCSIPPGQITCLIGPSGSGKTTLLRALALLENPDQGSIQVDETRYDFPLASGQKIAAPYPGVTVVFQSLFLSSSAFYLQSLCRSWVIFCHPKNRTPLNYRLTNVASLPKKMLDFLLMFVIISSPSCLLFSI